MPGIAGNMGAVMPDIGGMMGGMDRGRPGMGMVGIVGIAGGSMPGREGRPGRGGKEDGPGELACKIYISLFHLNSGLQVMSICLKNNDVAWTLFDSVVWSFT